MRLVSGFSVGEITSLPGCSQIAVSHGVFVPKSLRGMGHGRAGNKIRLEQIASLGYNYVICTVDKDNVEEISVLEKNGWRVLDGFCSSKSGCYIGIYGKFIVPKIGESNGN